MRAGLMLVLATLILAGCAMEAGSREPFLRSLIEAEIAHSCSLTYSGYGADSDFHALRNDSAEALGSLSRARGYLIEYQGLLDHDALSAKGDALSIEALEHEARAIGKAAELNIYLSSGAPVDEYAITLAAETISERNRAIETYRTIRTFYPEASYQIDADARMDELEIKRAENVGAIRLMIEERERSGPLSLFLKEWICLEAQVC